MLDVLLLAVALANGPGPGVALLPPQPVDTIIEVRPGDRVVLENILGEIFIEASDGDGLEVRGEDAEAALRVRRSGSTLRIVSDDSKGRRRGVEATIRLPAGVDVEITGLSLDVSVIGMNGRIDVRNVSGDIWIENVGGAVDVRTIEGEIDVVRARAGVRASSQSDDVRLRSVSGPIAVHSGSGNIELVDIVSGSVRAETQDGDIEFSGSIERGGEYGFFVHDGDVVIEIPSSAGAEVSVSTFDGDFESEFPVVIERFTGGRKFDFTLGDGDARIQIQVFDGEIRLLRRR